MRKFLKQRRQNAGLTLAQLSEKSGIALSTLGNFEKGRSNLSKEKLRSLAAFLGCSPEEISKSEDEHQKSETDKKSQVAEPIDPWLSDYRIPRNAAHALEILSDEDLSKYIRLEIDAPTSMPDTAFGALMHEWTRRAKRDAKAKPAETKYPTGKPRDEAG